MAVACAVEALANNEVDRIILVRPAVEAGERLGFLPGDIGQKVDPYLRPLYDALYEMLGFDRVGKLLDRGVIELAPLAYMRGRTLNESFIILDEAQNSTVEQMEMFLTRIGLRFEGSDRGGYYAGRLAQRHGIRSAFMRPRRLLTLRVFRSLVSYHGMLFAILWSSVSSRCLRRVP